MLNKTINHLIHQSSVLRKSDFDPAAVSELQELLWALYHTDVAARRLETRSLDPLAFDRVQGLGLVTRELLTPRGAELAMFLLRVYTSLRDLH